MTYPLRSIVKTDTTCIYDYKCPTSDCCGCSSRHCDENVSYLLDLLAEVAEYGTNSPLQERIESVLEHMPKKIGKDYE